MNFLDYAFPSYEHLQVYLEVRDMEKIAATDVSTVLEKEGGNLFQSLHFLQDLTRVELLEEVIDIEESKIAKGPGAFISKFRYVPKESPASNCLRKVPFEDLCSNENEFGMFKEMSGVLNNGLINVLRERAKLGHNGYSTEHLYSKGFKLEDIKKYLDKLVMLGAVDIHITDDPFPCYASPPKTPNKQSESFRWFGLSVLNLMGDNGFDPKIHL